MGRVETGSVAQQLRRLFGEGTVAGLAEGELLRRYLERRDEEAFGAIVARHGPMVMGVCRRVLGDARDVDDAFQVTFLTLARKAGTLGRDDPVGHWLYGVAYRVALRARTAAGRRRAREGAGPLPEVVASEDPADPELGALIDEELARLPAKYRSPILLCYVEGLTHEEAGRQLGWPVGTVKGRLARARGLLKDRLSRRGVSPGAGASIPGFLRTSGAPVPASVAARATRAALEIAAGRAAGVVPATAAALMNEGPWAMFLTKMKLTAAVLLTLVAGAAVLAYQAPGGADGREVGGQARPVEDRQVLTKASRPAPPADPAKAPAVPPTGTLEALMARLAERDLSEQGRAIHEAIALPVAMKFPNETPLEDVIKYVKKATEGPGLPNGIPIYVDPQGLNDADKTMASTVSLDLDGVALKVTLGLALKQLGLTYEIKDGFMTITNVDNEDHLPPFLLVQRKAERGELTRDQYEELIEILKLRNEVANLTKAWGQRDDVKVDRP